MDTLKTKSTSEFMRMAVAEGRKGLGLVHPNPAVGCVIVAESGDLVAKGAHLSFGGPHAEIEALNSVVDRDKLKGATVYVSLEPCSHEGKTPSCARTLAQLPISKVVYGVKDPNPQVSGKGVDILKAAGISVEKLEDQQMVNECEKLAEIFLWNQRKNSPFIALKAATSRNGSLVPEGGTGWVTGEESRKHVHFLRSQYDCVLIGVETFLKDDPKLNIRLESQPERDNVVVVLDPDVRGFEKLENSKLFSCRPQEKIIWVVKEIPDTEFDNRFLKAPFDDEKGFDLGFIVEQLWAMTMRSIFIEGGAKTYGAFLNAGLVNRIYQYTSPVDVGEEWKLDWLSEVTTEITPSGPIETFELGADRFESLLLSR